MLPSTGIANKVKEIQYIPGFKTDHSLIYMAIQNTNEPRGPGYWKFNTRLLHDKDYVDECNEEIEKAPQKYCNSDRAMRCELTKNACNQIAKKWSKIRAQEKHKRFCMLSERLLEVEQEISMSKDITKENLILCHSNIQQQLEYVIEQDTASAAFRSRSHYLKDGEKNSKYFFSLEKAKYNRKVMSTIVTEDGTNITEPKAIREEQRKFYKNLYTEDKSVKFSLQNNSDYLLTEQQKCEVDKMITI